MRKLSAFVLVLAACAASPKKKPDGPAPDDVPQEVTCCITTAPDGSNDHQVVALDKCPEDNRNPVDACNIGPGDDEPTN